MCSTTTQLSTPNYSEYFRQELRAHYELPKYLPHQILTLMTALNGQDERFERSREAKDAFALFVAGVIVVMAVWNLILFFYGLRRSGPAAKSPAGSSKQFSRRRTVTF